jgi:hypothetical protein
MGVCVSLCPKDDRTNLDHRLSALEIHEKSDTSSDEALKAKGTAERDKAPLLDGPTLGFHNLSLSESDGSLDDQINDETAQVGALLKSRAAAPKEAPSGRTFPKVQPDLNIKDLPSSDSEEV